jgi:hypothetical protein
MLFAGYETVHQENGFGREVEVGRMSPNSSGC